MVKHEKNINLKQFPTLWKCVKWCQVSTLPMNSPNFSVFVFEIPWNKSCHHGPVTTKSLPNLIQDFTRVSMKASSSSVEVQYVLSILIGFVVYQVTWKLVISPKILTKDLPVFTPPGNYITYLLQRLLGRSFSAFIGGGYSLPAGPHSVSSLFVAAQWPSSPKGMTLRDV